MPITREQFINEVAAISSDYEPNPDVSDQLAGIDLTTVSSPAGMGKDSLIFASNIPRVLAETIREPRKNNGIWERNGIEYEFRGENLDAVLDDLRNRRHVQIGMGPGRDSFYGSRIANYPSSGPALIDVMTS